MTTQSPDRQVETLEEIAERIVLSVAANPDLVSYPDAGDRQLWYLAILSALRNERARCAKIAKTIPDSKFDLDHEPAPTEQQIRASIAAAIREGR